MRRSGQNRWERRLPALRPLPRELDSARDGQPNRRYSVREKIEPDPKSPYYILTIRGVDYRFAEMQPS
jgi:hypothetical protein